MRPPAIDISLQLAGRELLAAPAAGTSHAAGLRLAPGALPPPGLIAQAAEQLRLGIDPLWASFFLFVGGQPPQALGAGGFRGPPVLGRVEVGYNVAAQWQGRGIATAALRQLLELAFGRTEVSEVFAETGLANAASRRVVEKAGFRRIGSRTSADDGAVDQWLCSR